FFLLSLLCYVRGRESRREEGAGGRGWFAGAAAAGLLALGAKETAITLPFFVFLYEWYFFRDLDRRWLQKSLPTVAVALVIVLLGCLLYAKGHPWRLVVDSYAYRDFSLTERVLTQWRVLFFYLSLLCYPHPGRLSLDHDFLLSRSLIQPPTTLASLVGLLALVAVGVVIARRQRLLSFAIFWFLGNLFLTSSIIGIELVFEHRLYLPSAFLVAAVTLLLFRVVRCRAAAIGILSLAVILLGYWTYSRNQTWRDPVAFHRDLVRKAPAKSRPHYNLGVELMGHAGFEQEAIAEFSRALALEPRLLMAHSQLGLAYGRIGALDQAIFHFRQVLALQPDDVAANFTIGVLFRQKGDLVRARDHLFRALQHAPDDVTIMTNLALLFHHSGNLPAALSFYRQAIARQPGNADILNNIGVILREEGRLAQAEQYFRRALAIAPAHPQARANLQGVLAAEPSAR
ncbi:MAG: tetratricopeptide repeat protein, partial [Desulfobulbaceae bacterium]|nr:tetratricopeptide repeat protein [Desulfobulbaceae bacterium]